MAGVKIVDLPSLGRDLISTDLLELSLVGGSGSRKITGQEIMNASKLNVGATPIINGTAGRILFQGAGDVLGESGNLFWDNTNGRLGVGTSSPSQSIDILSGNLTLRSSSSPSINIGTGGYPKLSLNSRTAIQEEGSTFMSIGRGYSNIGFYLSNTQIAAFASTGNLLINTGTDGGYKLDVNGTARVGSTLTVGSPAGNGLINICRTDNAVMSTISSPDACIINNGQGSGIRLSVVNTTYLNVRGFSSQFAVNITGALTAVTGLSNALLVNNVISASANNDTLIGLDINPTFNTGAFTGVETLALRVTGFISNFTSSGATQLRIIGPSGSNKSLFFFNSSTTFASTRIYNAGTTNHLVFATGDSLSNPTDRLTIFASTGNIAINTTTDAGFKLDVNGTARVSGDATLGSSSTTGTVEVRGSNIVIFRVNDVLNNNNTGIYKNATSGYLFESSSANQLSYGYASNYWMSWRNSTKSIAIASTGSEPTPAATAIFDLQSTTKGFLPPRMTNAQRAAIASPAVGLIVYCTDSTEGLYVYKSTGWTFMV